MRDSQGHVRSGVVRSDWMIPSVLIVSTAAVFWPTVSRLVDGWLGGGAYAHGPLVIGAAIWVTLRRGIVFQAESAIVRLPFVLLLLLAGLGWSAAMLAHSRFAEDTMLFAILVAFVGATGGVSALRRLALPLLLVSLALPVWDVTVPVLQQIAVVGVSVLLRLVGLPVAIDGNLVEIPAGAFLIEGGCSGLRYFLAAMSLALIGGEWFALTTRRRWVLCAAAAVLSIVGNWGRIIGVVLIGHLEGMSHPLVADHFWVGWVIFAFLVLPVLMSMLYRLSGRNLSRTSWTLPKWGNVSNTALAGGFLGGFVLPALAGIGYVVTAPGGDLAIAFPAGNSGWFGPMLTGSCPWVDVPSSADATGCAIYERPGRSAVYASVVAVKRESSETEVIGGDGAGRSDGWSTEGMADAISGVSGIESVGTRTLRDRGGTRWRNWYWYEVDGRTTHSRSRAKVNEALAFYRQGPTAVVELAVPCPERCQEMDVYLQTFLESHPRIRRPVEYALPADPNDGSTAGFTS